MGKKSEIQIRLEKELREEREHNAKLLESIAKSNYRITVYEDMLNGKEEK